LIVSFAEQAAKKRVDLFIVLPLAATGFNQDEALGVANLLRVQRASLVVLCDDLVCLAVEELEGRQDLRQLLLDGLEQREHVVERGQC
jgi:hypothetical protein